MKRSHDKVATIRKRYLRKEIEVIAREVGFTPIQIQYRLSFALPLFLISKLCEFGPRSDFIVKTFRDLLIESKGNEEDAQIMGEGQKNV